jgi:hypothetical protein
MSKLYKYPRTFHLPWSTGTSDDKTLSSDSIFRGKRVVCTLKMDGENTSLYKTHIHARSLDSVAHTSRDWVKGLWGKINYLIDDDMRICGENLFAVHTIKYQTLASYFLCFNIWKEEKCLSWDETVEICSILGIETVPVFYRGIYDAEKIKEEFSKYTEHEGYVIRLEDGFLYKDFSKSVAKYVKAEFKTNLEKSETHWIQNKVEKNGLRGI